MKEKMEKVKAWMNKNRDYIVEGALVIGEVVGGVILFKKTKERARETAETIKQCVTAFSKIGVQALKDDKYTDEEIEEILKED